MIKALSVFRLKCKRYAIVAIAKAGWRWSIIEDMSLVTTTAGAVIFCSFIAKPIVRFRFNCII